MLSFIEVRGSFARRRDAASIARYSLWRRVSQGFLFLLNMLSPAEASDSVHRAGRGCVGPAWLDCPGVLFLAQATPELLPKSEHYRDFVQVVQPTPRVPDHVRLRHSPARLQPTFPQTFDFKCQFSCALHQDCSLAWFGLPLQPSNRGQRRKPFGEEVDALPEGKVPGLRVLIQPPARRGLKRTYANSALLSFQRRAAGRNPLVKPGFGIDIARLLDSDIVRQVADPSMMSDKTRAGLVSGLQV